MSGSKPEAGEMVIYRVSEDDAMTYPLFMGEHDIMCKAVITAVYVDGDVDLNVFVTNGCQGVNNKFEGTEPGMWSRAKSIV